MQQRLSNRQTVFCVMRADISNNQVVCAVTADDTRADELSGEFEQAWADRGFNKEDFHFYVSASAFYL